MIEFSRRGALLGGWSAIAAPKPARTQSARRWRMTTSWSRDLLGPGVSAQRLARRIGIMSAGSLEIQVFAASEVVPALQVFDAVAVGAVEMGHSSASLWQDKIPASPLFCTAPFGLSPIAHVSWIDGEGQGLWDALYAAFNVKPLLAGNIGPAAAGWFRAPMRALEDFEGLRICASGMGGEVYRRLGAKPIALSPEEAYAAFERGAIDGAELFAPAADLALGFQAIAPYLLFPGFNKPNGASELLIGRAAWEELPPHLKAIIEAAARMEHDQALADAHRSNADAISKLTRNATTTLSRLSEPALRRIAGLADEILNELALRDALSGRIVASYRAQRTRGAHTWEEMTRR